MTAGFVAVWQICAMSWLSHIHEIFCLDCGDRRMLVWNVTCRRGTAKAQSSINETSRLAFHFFNSIHDHICAMVCFSSKRGRELAQLQAGAPTFVRFVPRYVLRILVRLNIRVG
jgi:hypothetical protein